MKIKNLILLSTALCSGLINSAFGAKPPKLKNFGATCFQNATLQALYNIQPITNFLVNNPNPYPAKTIAHLYTQLVKQLRRQSPESTVHYPLLQELAKYGYALVGQCSLAEGCTLLEDCHQEDASEFMVQLLDRLMSSHPNYDYLTPEQLLEQNPIGKIIAINEATTVSCDAINFNSTQIRPISYLNVEARRIKVENNQPKSVPLTTLTQCLANYFTTELLNDPNNYYKLELTDEQLPHATPEQMANNQKPIPNCTKTIRLASTSDIVIISLKRTTFSLATGQAIKLNHPITLPAQINFKPYMTHEAAALPQPNYELIGAIHHSGQAQGGHYIAFVKNNNEWYICNDTHIQLADWDAIQAQVNMSYVAIYQRQKLSTPPAADIAPIVIDAQPAGVNERTPAPSEPAETKEESSTTQPPALIIQAPSPADLPPPPANIPPYPTSLPTKPIGLPEVLPPPPSVPPLAAESQLPPEIIQPEPSETLEQDDNLIQALKALQVALDGLHATLIQ